jgi:hypothetical protein
VKIEITKSTEERCRTADDTEIALEERKGEHERKKGKTVWLSGRGVGYERMCAAGYKRHGNEMIAQDALCNSEGRRYLLLLKGSSSRT